jgi:hypothetical protein
VSVVCLVDQSGNKVQMQRIFTPHQLALVEAVDGEGHASQLSLVKGDFLVRCLCVVGDGIHTQVGIVYSKGLYRMRSVRAANFV